MNLSINELRSFHPIENRVIVKAAIDTSKFKYGSVEFYSPLSLSDGKPYDPFKSQPVVCTVIAPPRRLIFGKRKVFWETVEELDLPIETRIYLHKCRREAKFSETTIIDAPIPGSMPWCVSVRIKQDDIVWVNSNALYNAEKRHDTIICDGVLYYIIKYEDIYMRKTGDAVEMLNGWVLAELIEDTLEWRKRIEKLGLIVPKHLKKTGFDDKYGLIRYIGEPVEYLFNDQYDHIEINWGDVVMFKWKVNRRLEPGMKFFAKDNDLIVTRRSNIIAIME